MTKSRKLQTEGRKANAAQPLGDRHGVVSDGDAKRTGAASRRAAGPDGPDARAVGDAFKTPPGSGR